MHSYVAHLKAKSRYFFKKTLTKGLSFIHLQLVMTSLSWPFLSAWGLPLSKATLLGNALFAPFLTLFLLLSTCIFISELIGFPSLVFTIPLEYLTSTWTSLLMRGNRSWLFSLAQSPTWVYLLFIGSIGLLMHCRLLRSSFISSVCLIGLMGSTILLVKSTISRTPVTEPLACFEKELLLIYSSKGVILINPGCLGRRLSAPSFVSHTLIPELRKRGISTIDAYICSSPSTLNFLASATLLEIIPVKNVYLPKWTGKLSNKGWSSWEKLILTADRSTTAVTTLGAGERLSLGPLNLVIETSSKRRKNGCIFSPLQSIYKNQIISSS